MWRRVWVCDGEPNTGDARGRKTLKPMIAAVGCLMNRTFRIGCIIGIIIVSLILSNPETVPCSAEVSPEERTIPWTNWRGSDQHLGSSGGPTPSEGKLRWSFRTADQVQSSPVFHDGILLIGSDDGRLYALEADTGELQWKFTTEGTVQATPLVLEDRAYFGSSDGFFYCLAIPEKSAAITEPEVVWKYQCGAPIVSSAHVHNGTLLFGGQDGFFYSLSLEGDFLWKTEIGWEIWASPLIDPIRSRAFIGATNGNFSCIDLVEKKVVWTIDAGEIYSSGCLWNDTIFLGSGRDHEFMAIHPENGSVIWTFDTELPVYSTPAYHDERLYFTSYERAWCLPARDTDSNGIINETEMIWTTSIHDREGGSSPLVAGGVVYAGSDDGSLYCLDAGSGEVMWNFTTQGYVYSSPSLYNGSLYVGSSDNSIYCIGNRLIGLHILVEMERDEMNSDQTQLITISVTDQNGTRVEGAVVTFSLSAGDVELVGGAGNPTTNEGRFLTDVQGRITVRFQPPQVSSRSTIDITVTAERSGMRPAKAHGSIALEPGTDQDLDSPVGDVSNVHERRLPYYYLLSLFIIIDVCLAGVIMRSGNPGSGMNHKEGVDHTRD